MRDKKLILRVITKLFAVFALLVVAYVFMLGLLSHENIATDEPVVVDVSELKPGAVKYFDHKRRKILVLHRSSGQFLVAYASDPIFGCPIEWQDGKFVSICNGSRFDEAGKVYKGQLTDEDMNKLPFDVDENGKLTIRYE